MPDLRPVQESFARSLRCRECGHEYPLAPSNVCEWCFGPLEVFYDYAAIKSRISRQRIESGPPTMWRYGDLLPVDAATAVDIGTGYTPLVRAPNLGRALGLNRLYIKNDCQNPTWSFKDRVVSVASSVARSFEFDTLACASTGNLANSVAAHAARAGMRACVFIPADLEQGKIIGSAVYSPTLVAVEGSYDDVNRLCSELGDKYPWAFVNINVRPYYAEGSKTLGYEVCEQLGWRAPDHCIVPMASGSLFTKIYKGIKEMAWLGLIDWQGTRMSGAQALGCSPIAEAFGRQSMNIRPQKPNTIAKSLAIGNPADGYYALKTMKDSNGAATAVTDDEVVEGIRLLAETEGIFAETAGGVVISGLRRLVREGTVHPDEVVVAFITGAGLKTQEAVAGALQPPLTIEPTIESFEQAFEDREGSLPLAKAV
ncbi:MAG TPA: threonine synthase [Dehalococcoidia bacterium]|nr:threonine synthase [Dehalococcoidia bacterium]